MEVQQNYLGEKNSDRSRAPSSTSSIQISRTVIPHLSEVQDQYFTFFKSIQKTTTDLYNQDLQLHGVIYSKSQFYPNPTVYVTESSENLEILEIQVKLSHFICKIKLLNVDSFSSARDCLQLINCGSYGRIYQQTIDGSTFVIKSINISSLSTSVINKKKYDKEQQKIWKKKYDYTQLHSAIVQYAICKVCSALRIGPNVRTILGFDMICYRDSVQFSMQFCDAINGARGVCWSKDLQQQLKISLKFLHCLHIVHNDIKPENVGYSSRFKKAVFIDYGGSDIIRQMPGQQTLYRYIGSFNFCGRQMKALLQLKQPGYIDLYLNDIQCFQNTINFFDKQREMGLTVTLQIERIQRSNEQKEQSVYNEDQNSQRINCIQESAQYQICNKTKTFQKYDDKCLQETSDIQKASKDKFSLLEIKSQIQHVKFLILTRNRQSLRDYLQIIVNRFISNQLFLQLVKFLIEIPVSDFMRQLYLEYFQPRVLSNQNLNQHQKKLKDIYNNYESPLSFQMILKKQRRDIFYQRISQLSKANNRRHKTSQLFINPFVWSNNLTKIAKTGEVFQTFEYSVERMLKFKAKLLDNRSQLTKKQFWFYFICFYSQQCWSIHDVCEVRDRIQEEPEVQLNFKEPMRLGFYLRLAIFIILGDSQKPQFCQTFQTLQISKFRKIKQYSQLKIKNKFLQQKFKQQYQFVEKGHKQQFQYLVLLKAREFLINRMHDQFSLSLNQAMLNLIEYQLQTATGFVQNEHLVLRSVQALWFKLSTSFIYSRDLYKHYRLQFYQKSFTRLKQLRFQLGQKIGQRIQIYETIVEIMEAMLVIIGVKRGLRHQSKNKIKEIKQKIDRNYYIKEFKFHCFQKTLSETIQEILLQIYRNCSTQFMLAQQRKFNQAQAKYLRFNKVSSILLPLSHLNFAAQVSNKNNLTIKYLIARERFKKLKGIFIECASFFNQKNETFRVLINQHLFKEAKQFYVANISKLEYRSYLLFYLFVKQINSIRSFNFQFYQQYFYPEIGKKNKYNSFMDTIKIIVQVLAILIDHSTYVTQKQLFQFFNLYQKLLSQKNGGRPIQYFYLKGRLLMVYSNDSSEINQCFDAAINSKAQTQVQLSDILKCKMARLTNRYLQQIKKVQKANQVQAKSNFNHCIQEFIALYQQMTTTDPNVFCIALLRNFYPYFYFFARSIFFSQSKRYDIFIDIFRLLAEYTARQCNLSKLNKSFHQFSPFISAFKCIFDHTAQQKLTQVIKYVSQNSKAIEMIAKSASLFIYPIFLLLREFYTLSLKKLVAKQCFLSLMQIIKKGISKIPERFTNLMLKQMHKHVAFLYIQFYSKSDRKRNYQRKIRFHFNKHNRYNNFEKQQKTKFKKELGFQRKKVRPDFFQTNKNAFQKMIKKRQINQNM